MRILLIEDDALVATSVELMLTTQGYKAEIADRGEDGIDLARNYDFDAIVLDLGLPDISGMRVLKAIRAAMVKTPVLVLSGDANVTTRIEALSQGADDFVTKPFHKGELLARLRAVVRRSCDVTQSMLKIGDIVVNLDARTASVGNSVLKLTSKEYQMLEVLSLRRGATLSKDTLLNHLYGGMDEPDQKIIDVFICKLRKKLSTATNGAEYIKTVWGRGYQLIDPASERLAA
jgi:two-component system cell cycle response regulator CtrA